MKTYRWAKLWIDILDDWKWGTLPDSSKVRFIECMLVAKEYNAGGVLPPLREMAYRLRIDTDTLTADLMRLAQNELVELTDHEGEERWWLPNFEKRQETPMTSTERVRAYRERERQEALNETDSNANETPVKRRVSQEGEEEEEKKEKESRTRTRATAPKQPVQPPPQPSSPPSKKKQPDAETLAHGHMINALGEVCGMSPYLNFDKLSDPAAQLIEAGYTEAQVRTHYARPDGWWYQRDWRGQKGEYPRPAQVIETIYGAIVQSRPTHTEGGKLWLDHIKVFDS